MKRNYQETVTHFGVPDHDHLLLNFPELESLTEVLDKLSRLLHAICRSEENNPAPPSWFEAIIVFALVVKVMDLKSTDPLVLAAIRANDDQGLDNFPLLDDLVND